MISPPPPAPPCVLEITRTQTRAWALLASALTCAGVLLRQPMFAGDAYGSKPGDSKLECACALNDAVLQSGGQKQPTPLTT